jgi:hypothetical protein
MRIFIIVILGMLLMSCNKSEELRLSQLTKSWTHSFEEETTDEVHIYRPSNYKVFPSSRFRQVIIFKRKNKCEYYVLAPNDAHYMEKGVWELSGQQQFIVVKDLKSRIQFEFEIIEFSKDILKMKKVK